MKTVLKRYEYPIKKLNGEVYYGSYTIKEGVAPMNFKGEKLIQTFEANVK